MMRRFGELNAVRLEQTISLALRHAALGAVSSYGLLYHGPPWMLIREVGYQLWHDASAS